MIFSILYEDDSLLALDKPAGVPSCGVGSVEEWLISRWPSAKLVHRLDNDTSGVLIAAKTEEAFETLRGLWKTPQVIKKYQALVLGRAPSHGIINTPIAHHARKKKKMMVGGDKARPAQTEYKTIQHYKNYSLLEVQITTGIRHQIRTHLASISHPIAGDRLYQKLKKRPLDMLYLSRHFLHLAEIILPHPLTKIPLRLISPLPLELKKILETL